MMPQQQTKKFSSIAAKRMPDWIVRGRHQLEEAANRILALSVDKPWRISVGPYRVRRSPDQNNRAWALYRAIADETGYSPGDIHEICKRKFGEPRVIEVAGVRVEEYSTRDKDVAWMSMFLERLEAWAASEFGVVIGG